MPYGTPRAEYHAAFRAGLETLADRIRPELVLISAGFDAHAEDPVGDLGLEVEDFEILTREIVVGRRDPRRRADRERARRGLQRPDPGRLRRGPPRRAGRPSGAGSDAMRQSSRATRGGVAMRMTPTGFEPVLHA